MDKEHFDELQQWFWAETNEPETQEWRNRLSAEDAEIVATWDAEVDVGFCNLIRQLAAAIEKNAKLKSTPETSDDITIKGDTKK